VVRKSDATGTGETVISWVKSMGVLDFKVLLEPDGTGGYVVVCPSLQGCYSQGETIDEALTNIREAIQLCLDELRDRGEPLPDPSNVLIGSVIVPQ
jgi:predicted RNase H-like HicB family nuclease